MSLFAIGDLHLSFANPKPMDLFGEKWKNHEQKIKPMAAVGEPGERSGCGDLLGHAAAGGDE